MKTPTVIRAGLLALALSPPVVFAQQTQAMQAGGTGPAGDPGMQQERPMTTGTGRITGRVVTAGVGSPVRGANVQISGSQDVAKMHTTDDEGRYEFRDLPSGSYTIRAVRSGYTSAAYGQTKPFGPGKLIELMESKPVDGADIMMPRRGAISGRLVDEFGDPMPDAVVNAIRPTWVNGKRRLRGAVRTARTNDLGQYRLQDLDPGEYYISATLPSAAEIMAKAGLWRFSSASEHSGMEPRTGYATTYYPGTQTGADAQRIALGPSEHRQSTDFALLPVKLATVTGTVFGSSGRPLDGAMVNAVHRNSGGTIDGAGTDKSGNFTIPGVAPGEYTLRARSRSVTMSRDEDAALTISMGAGDQTEFGSVLLTVSGEDVARVRIVTSRGTTAAGRVTWEGGARPGNTAALRVRAIPIESDAQAPAGADPAPVSPDGTFDMEGIAGQKLFRLTGLPEGWGLKSVTLNGQDIIDTGIDLEPNKPVTGLEIVLSSRVTVVSGLVKAGTDQATDFTVVIFAEDARKWTMPMTRYIAAALPTPDGGFQVRNLPAGTYYAVAVAVEYIPRNDWNDPAVLERLKAKATRFTLEEGKTETLELQLSGS